MFCVNFFKKSQWLGVQELWHNLEAVFDSQGLGHEFGKEAARFASADKIWKSLMKASIETKNVIQVRPAVYIVEVYCIEQPHLPPPPPPPPICNM